MSENQEKEVFPDVQEETLQYRERYKVCYRIDYEPKGKTPEEIMAANLGATDVLILISIIKEESGATSTAILSLDGETGGKASADDKFKSWIHMAKDLSEDPNLGPGRKMFVKQTWETVREMILEARKNG